MVIYNDGRVAVIILDNGDVRIDRRTICGINDSMDSVTIPNRIARYIDFDDLANLDMIAINN